MSARIRIWGLKSINLLIISSLLSVGSLFAQEQQEVHVKQGFLRDMMMPVGLPFVTFFHTIREHPFLNTAFQGAGCIESLGNTILLPCRYLFCGKIAEQNHQKKIWQVEQEFRYKKWPRLTASLSVLTLPIALPLGAAMKGLAFLSPEVRMRHAEFQTARSALALTSLSEEYQRLGISYLYSNDRALCLHHARPTKPTALQRREIDALREIAELLEKHGIVYWIDCGTCLGAYRYGGRIPWDWDIDIAVLLPDHDNVRRVLSQLDPKKYALQDWSCYSRPKSLFKLYVKESKNFIDIYHYEIDPSTRTISYYYTGKESSLPLSWQKRELAACHPFSYDDIFPLVRAEFDGLSLWAPHKIVNYLQGLYGENLDPVMVWNEERQQYLKVEEHPYWLTQ